MDDLAQMFTQESKVVISPDEMRAWVMLPSPQKDHPYTEEGLQAWLLQNGVTFGVRDDMIKAALHNRINGELMEVARGTEAQEGTPGRLVYKVDQQENANIRTGLDGGLVLDDLSFLQELKAGTVLAETMLPVQGIPGCTVNGRVLPPKNTLPPTKDLDGFGFEKSEDGLQYFVPVDSHIRFIDGSMQLTPVLHVESLCEQDGPLEFEGDIVIDKDVLANSVIKGGASVYVAGHCQESTIEAKRNIVLCGGISPLYGRGTLQAKDNIWAKHFERADLKAGRDISAEHFRGCEVVAGGQVRALGRQGLVVGCEIHAKGGLICQILGGDEDTSTEIFVGLEKSLLKRGQEVAQSIEKRNQDVQRMIQSLSAFEKLNRQKPNKGKDLPEYKDMEKKKMASLQVLKMLELERQNIKRKMDSMSSAGVVARDRVFPGVLISIDTREYVTDRKFGKVRFKREGEYIEKLAVQ